MSKKGRPVYILGAGFSRAISSEMPVTDELGREIKRRLKGEIAFNLRSGQTFEEWLTLQMTPLPFLPAHVNARRSAGAARVISEIASILDLRSDSAANTDVPPWLLALVQVWGAEGAIIITFNYDLLLERAVTHARLVSRPGHIIRYGDELVFPAPSVTSAQYAGDTGLDHLSGSFQVLKMHGSLNWFGSGSKSGSADLLRSREKRGYAGHEAMIADVDYSGLRQLDRYLIPPMTSKDGYYSSSMMTSIWREAGVAISEATDLFILGYSLPQEDRVVGELLAGVPVKVSVGVVDLDPGSIEDARGVVGRLGRLELDAKPLTDGSEAISRFADLRCVELADNFVKRLPELPSEFDCLPIFLHRNELSHGSRSAEQYGLEVEGPHVLSLGDKMPPPYARSDKTSALSIARLKAIGADGQKLALRLGEGEGSVLVVGLELSDGEAYLLTAASPVACYPTIGDNGGT
ncbi:SIR2 family protein [Rathayibacter sp. VKM Ac-2630]|uniref:SIR2 family protein n=1 Tax=Rathayibacter sp. VKM Ac-2630 TaxID=1938617 RepID=UPI0011158AEE|nr:SIR2 family protein [Rathayibacter sp. VKM Ac-2630]